MANSIKKLCIDSRFSAPGSTGNADLVYVLTKSIHIPDNMFMYATDVCIPRSWCTLDNFNQYLFSRVKSRANNMVNNFEIALSHMSYTLQSLREDMEYELNDKTKK
jgi:hypothetical protein